MVKETQTDLLNGVLDLMDKSKSLPEQFKKKEIELFFNFDKEKNPLKKEVAFKKWKDFILSNIPK